MSYYKIKEKNNKIPCATTGELLQKKKKETYKISPEVTLNHNGSRDSISLRKRTVGA